MADVTEGKVITESSLIPYIRKQDVMFDADNLRPNRLARLWFDDIAMNLFAQRGNQIVLNSKKVITVNPNTGSTILADDTFYQGSSNLAPTFSGTVDAYYSANTTLVISNLSGNFDDAANVSIEVANTFGGRTTGIVAATGNISRVVNQNTSDVFVQDEGLRCANTNTFFKVIGSSGENLLYVNENFIQCNVAALAPNTFSATAFSVGDLVYQTATGANTFADATFVGRVEYYNVNSPAILAISAVRGQLNVNSSINVSTYMWNSSNAAAKPLHVTGQRLYNLSNGHVLISTSNTTRVTIVSHEHTSGAVQNTTGNLDSIYISSSADAANAVGNLVYITSGTGLGQWRRVTSASDKQLNLADSLLVEPTSNTTYSIGNHIVDNNGTLAGILNIPEEPNFKFRTGERVFTITDTDRLEDSDYTMKASAKFATSGLQTVMQDLNLQFPTTPIVIPVPPTPPDVPIPEPAPTEPPVATVPPVPPRPWWEENFRRFAPRFRGGDPIAQTFFTPKPQSNKTSYGTFVSSVDLFFGAQPSTALGALQLPVSVKIARVQNGFPTKNYIAISTVKCKDVKVSTAPSVGNTDTITKFTFKDPVYLLPDTEYALVVYSDSPEYEVFIAELGGDVLGADPPQRISEQPYAGSFFRSQNATTWTPYQNEDLMFVIHKAVFESTGTATFNLKDAPEQSMNVDRLLLNTNKLTFPVGSVDFKVKGIYKSNTAYDNYAYITPHQQFEYGKLNETSSTYLNTRKIVRGNSNSLYVLAEFASSDPDVSAVFNKQTLSIIDGEHDVNNGGISNNIISITNRGAGYNAFVTTGNAVFGSSDNTLNNAAQLFREQYLANNFNIGFYNLTVAGGEGSGADGFAVANTDGSNTVNYIVVNSGGSQYIETPTLTIANGNATTGMVTATAKAQGETGKRGGNINARYLTRQITLEEGFESGDIRVFMDCIRPTGTDIQVYYKVLGSEAPDRFADKSWVRMSKAVDKNSKDTNQVIELTFRPDLLENKLKYTENGVQYPIGGKFKSFAIKVCLLTSDSTVVPVVTNMRIIATPEG